MLKNTISIFDCFPKEGKINVLYAISLLSDYSKYILRKIFGMDFKQAILNLDFNEQLDDNNIYKYLNLDMLTDKEKTIFIHEILVNLKTTLDLLHDTNNLQVSDIDLDEFRHDKAKFERKVAEYFGFKNYYMVLNIIKKQILKNKRKMGFKQYSEALELEKETIMDEINLRINNGVDIKLTLSPLEQEFLKLLNLKMFSNYLIGNVIKAIKFAMLSSGNVYSNRLSELVDFAKNNIFLIANILKTKSYLKINLSVDYFDDYYSLNSLMSSAFTELLNDPMMDLVECQKNMHYYINVLNDLAMSSLEMMLDETGEEVCRKRC